MNDYISELPDDLVCYILSCLTVRDSFRVRSLSSKWKDLPDTRSVLQFDSNTILGKESFVIGCEFDHNTIFEGGSSTLRRQFVKAVDQFFKYWVAPKVTALKIQFLLGNEHASYIDGWIRSVTSKEVEELYLKFQADSFFTKPNSDKYVFPCQLLNPATNSLKHLRLISCNLTRFSDASSSWLSKVITIEFTSVSLRLSDIECILSNGLNLESLSLIRCGLQGHLFVRHPFLKKLVITEDCVHVELSCPRLETFVFCGCTDFTFSSVPLLSYMSLKRFEIGGGSSVWNELSMNAPRLQTMSLWVTTEVSPPPPSMAMSCLKRLVLTVKNFPSIFDFFSITHIIHASPVLEALHLELEPNDTSEERHQRHYVDRPHFHLKEVRIRGISMEFSLCELVNYLLRNGVSLERVVFVVGAEYHPCMSGPWLEMWLDIHPTVQIIAE